MTPTYNKFDSAESAHNSKNHSELELMQQIQQMEEARLTDNSVLGDNIISQGQDEHMEVH